VLDFQQGKLTEARAGYERALELAKQLGDVSAEQEETHALAVLDDQEGKYPEARIGYENALELAKQLGDVSAEATELRNLGMMLAQNLGEVATGRAMIEESLTLSERLGQVYETGKCHEFLAWLDRDAGNRLEAAEHYRQALQRYEQVNSPDAETVRHDLQRLERQP